MLRSIFRLRKLVFAVFFLITVAVTTDRVVAQANPKPNLLANVIDPGSIEGSVYTNKTLGIRIKYPAKMVVDDRQELDASVKEGLQAYKDWGGKDEKAAEALAKRERSVFGISTPNSNDEPISSLSLSVMKDATGGDLEAMVNRTIKMWTSAPNVKLIKPARKVDLAKLTFYSLDLSVESNGTTVRSRIYSTRRNGYLFTFAIVHVDDRGLEVMEKVLSEIELI